MSGSGAKEEGDRSDARSGPGSTLSLPETLRVIVITDQTLARPRNLHDVVEASLQAGAKAVQLRDKDASARQLLDTARALRELTTAWGALLFINDRLDVALAAEADGVHLGPDDLPVSLARRVSPKGFLIGHSTDIPEVAMQAVAEGADYIGCGAVFPTASKEDAGEVIGVQGLARVAAAVDVPVVGIGGVTPERAARIAAETAASGVAVIGAVMAAPDPGLAVRGLLEPFRTPRRKD